MKCTAQQRLKYNDDCIAIVLGRSAYFARLEQGYLFDVSVVRFLLRGV